MFNKSIVSETVTYKLLWQIFDSVLSYFSIFGTYLLLLQFSSGQNTGYIVLVLIIGLILKVLLELNDLYFVRFIGNLLPFIVTFLWISIFGSDMFEFLFKFLFIFAIYVLIVAISQEFLRFVSPIIGGLIFSFLQMSKLIFLLIIVIELISNLDGTFDIWLPILNNGFNISYRYLYIISNLVIISLSFFGLMILLIIRNMILSNIGGRLERVSRWSIDEKILENEIINNNVLLKNTRRTILFGDIRGFTEFTENTNTRTTAQLLEGFYVWVENVLAKCGGYKPEFIADEFLTYFDDSKSALLCAYELNNKLNEFLSDYNLSIGMGIDEGEVLEGVIGGNSSKKYTVLGRAVNIAARLQQNAKGGEILISEIVKNAYSEIEVEEVEGVKLKGLKSDMKVYSVKKVFENSNMNTGIVDKIKNKVNSLLKK